MPIDQQILIDFQLVSNTLIQEMLAVLEQCEGKSTQAPQLNEFAIRVDRIMGAARSLAVLDEKLEKIFTQIGDYSSLCKILGYQGTKMADRPELYNACVALLIDATEILQTLFAGSFDQNKPNLDEQIVKTLIDRAQWLSSQLPSTSLLPGQTISNPEIDRLLKKLGIQ